MWMWQGGYWNPEWAGTCQQLLWVLQGTRDQAESTHCIRYGQPSPMELWTNNRAKQNQPNALNYPTYLLETPCQPPVSSHSILMQLLMGHITSTLSSRDPSLNLVLWPVMLIAPDLAHFSSTVPNSLPNAGCCAQDRHCQLLHARMLRQAKCLLTHCTLLMQGASRLLRCVMICSQI